MEIFNRHVKYPNGSMEIGERMSSAAHAMDAVKRSEKGSETRFKAVGVMNKAIANLKNFATSQETVIGRFIRRLLNLFGIATNYQRLLNQIDHLEAEAGSLTEEEQTYLDQLHSQKGKSEKKIGKDVRILNLQFTEIEEAIAEVSRKARQVSELGTDYQEVQGLVSLYQKQLADMKESLSKLADIYQGDVNEFGSIPQLWERFKVVERQLREAANHLADLIQPRRPAPSEEAAPAQSPDASSFVPPGGISNGGNFCYVASTLQTMNNISVYRDLFNPDINPLQKRGTESTASFEQRKEIQEKGFALLNKVASGVKVSTSEGNAFRKACHSHHVGGARVISSLHGQSDARVLLDRLLTVLDYVEPQVFLNYQLEIDDLSDFEESPLNSKGQPRIPDPEEYPFLEDALKSSSKEGDFSLSAFPYLNGSVAMTQLVKDYYQGSELDEFVVMHKGDSGEVTFRKYRNGRRKVSLNLEKSEFPPVLRVTVAQLDGNRATITQPEEIYPSGIPGVGPKYRLKSVIEHMPGHYVAHVMSPFGMFTANDGWVHPRENNAIPGFAYYYERVEE